MTHTAGRAFSALGAVLVAGGIALPALSPPALVRSGPAPAENIAFHSLCWVDDTTSLWRVSNNKLFDIEGTLSGPVAASAVIPARTDWFVFATSETRTQASLTSGTWTPSTPGLVPKTRYTERERCVYHVVPTVSFPSSSAGADFSAYRLELESAIERVVFGYDPSAGALVLISETAKPGAADWMVRPAELDVPPGTSYAATQSGLPGGVLADPFTTEMMPPLLHTDDAMAFGAWFFGDPPRTGLNAQKYRYLDLDNPVDPTTTTTTSSSTTSSSTTTTTSSTTTSSSTTSSSTSVPPSSTSVPPTSSSTIAPTTVAPPTTAPPTTAPPSTTSSVLGTTVVPGTTTTAVSTSTTRRAVTTSTIGSGPGTGELPFTGGSSPALLIPGLALLVTGLAMTRAARRAD